MSTLASIGADRAIPELSPARYTARLTDIAGAGVAGASVTNIYVTLRELVNNAIVNSRNAVDMLASAEATVTAGDLAVNFVSADMAAIAASGSSRHQPRRLTLDIRLSGGGRVTHEVTFYVYDLHDVTA